MNGYLVIRSSQYDYICCYAWLWYAILVTLLITLLTDDYWLCMDAWFYMVIGGYTWLLVVKHGYSWLWVVIDGYTWL